MRQRNLLKAILLSGLGVASLQTASAQILKHSNIAGNIGGTRLVVTEPAVIVGVKNINYATWGTVASPTITGAVVQKAYDTLGVSPLLNGTGAYPSLSGKFALIYRGGGISFTDKVNRCITAGAVGVIIVNNIPGDPIAMGATPTGSTASVPVLMVTDVEGQAISDQIKGGTTVKITLGTWNTGGTHDLGIVTPFMSAPHALNIPLHQLTGSAGTEAFKLYAGGAVANYGTATETAVKVTDSIFWAPTGGGTTTFVSAHDYTVASVSPTDSIGFGFGPAAFSVTPPATTGRYDFRHSISYSNTDDFPQDNKATLSQYVTDSIYCKTNYDYVNKRPKTTIGIQVRDLTTPFVFGTMFYIKNGGYAARAAQYSISINGTPTLKGLTTYSYIYKWVDGSGGGTLDSFVQAAELTTVGNGALEFTDKDTSGDAFTVKYLDVFKPDSDIPVILEDNSWYFVAAEVPTSCFMGMDRSISSFTRSYAQFAVGGSKPGAAIYDNAVGAWYAPVSDFTGTGTNTLFTFPFGTDGKAGVGNVYNVDSVFYDAANNVPAIALMMSKDKPNSIIDAPGKGIGQVDVYPNPAVNGTLTVDVKLNATSKRVEYRLTDMVGRTLQSAVHTNVLNEQFQMNTSGLPTGNYFLTILSDQGLTNRKVTIKN